ncbi:PAS domain S-box protein [Argonema antarcticum]|uniref:PAS domain S-box protein n=1 Tax=Argonema antarcticum TaxID=2942763 RepID=UPI002012FA40|nr:PAS domain S-box protein [Argonema antarcticum]MCL1474563.1 PAS domain S-box protein [Argonema antarcticum A004/B2]
MKTANSPTILIVDDQPTNLKILFNFLQEEGFLVLIAKSGESALKKLAKILPDLILLDVMMPNIDGFEICRRLKAKPETQDIPVIFMTALADGVNKVKGLSVGGVDYITKPILKQEVLARINVHLKLRSVTRQLQEKNQLLEQEIGDRIIAETALRKSEQRFRQMANCISECFWIADIQMGQLLYVSPAYEQIWGRSCQSAYQERNSWLLAVHPEDQQQIQNSRERLFQGEGIEQEYRVIRPDGSMVWILDRTFPIWNESGEIYRLAGIAINITQRKQAEEALRESEQRFRAIFEQAAVASSISAPSGQLLRVNQKLCDFLGYTESELLSKTFQEITHPDDLEMDLRYYRQVLTGKIQTYSLEKRYIRKDRRLRWGNLTVSGVLEGDGGLSYLITALEDIQERKSAEKQLQYRLLLETALAEVSRELAINEAADIDRVMGILGVAVGANHTYVTRFRGNSTIADMVYEWCDSQTQPQIQNLQNVDSSLFPWWLKKYLKNENAVISDVDALPEAAELEKNLLKSLGVCSVLAVPINTQSGQPWGTIGFENFGENRKDWSQEDVQLLRIVGEMIYSYCTRSQAVAEKLRQAQYQQLLASLTLKIRESLSIEEILQTTVTQLQTTLNADRVLFFRLLPEATGKVVNEAVLTGFPIMQGQVIKDEALFDEYLERYRQGRIHVCFDVESAGFTSCYLEILQRYQIRSNLILPILVRNQVNLAQKHDTQDAESTANSQSQTPVNLWGLLCVQQCGETREWAQLEIELLQQLANQLGIALYQAQLLENQTRYSQELARSNAELEQFAYVASHDLQAPLGTIASYAELLEERYKDILDAKANNYIDKIVSGVIRMQRLIDDLLLYSRVGRSQKPFEPCDCNLVFEEACANLQATIRKSQASVTKSELPVVIADTSQLVQLFQNLIGNGIKYRREEPPLIRVSAFAFEGAWLFSVSDNGIGIDPKQSDRIFQIFQRLHTQKEYSGTGIGLAICQKIVERHGGRIWVESALGQGSTFYFTLPNSNF